MRNMWKRIAGIALAMILSLAGTAFAVEVEPGESRVYDLADLFSESEEMDLASSIAMLQEKMDMGVAIVTTEDNPGSAMEFADQWYEFYEIGFGKDYDGTLFLIDMDNGELWITTEGKMIRYLTDARIEAILDDVIEDAYDGYFYECAAGFLEDLEICYDNGIASDQYNYDTETGAVSKYKSIRWYEFLFALVVSGVVAGGVVLAVVREYNMKDDASRMAANFRLSYRKDSGFLLSDILTDILIGSHVTRTVIRSQSSSSGSSRSSGRGFSSGGRSSTHRSGSGRSHGGGGRKFR